MMDSEERNRLMADLRAAGVQEYVEDQHVVRIVFFPPPATAPPAAPDEERPLPPPPRTLEQRLFDPLGIGKKDDKG